MQQDPAGPSGQALMGFKEKKKFSDYSSMLDDVA